MQIDFFASKDLPVGPGTKYVVTKHMDNLVEKLFKDLDEFSLKVNLKERTLC